VSHDVWLMSGSFKLAGVVPITQPQLDTCIHTLYRGTWFIECYICRTWIVIWSAHHHRARFFSQYYMHLVQITTPLSTWPGPTVCYGICYFWNG
jgi:hypothetical protein